MDPTVLATEITAYLALVLPYLANMSQKAAEEASKKIGLDFLEKAIELVGKLRTKIDGKEAAQEAFNDVMASPEDKDAQAALRLQIKKILSEDEALAHEISDLWEGIKASSAKAIARGDRSVAIAGNANNSIIIIGDSNQVR